MYEKNIYIYTDVEAEERQDVASFCVISKRKKKT